MTLGHLKAERVDLAWVPAVRAVLLCAGAGFSAYLLARLCLTRRTLRSVAACLLAWLTLALVVGVWAQILFVR